MSKRNNHRGYCPDEAPAMRRALFSAGERKFAGTKIHFMGGRRYTVTCYVHLLGDKEVAREYVHRVGGHVWLHQFGAAQEGGQ